MIVPRHIAKAFTYLVPPPLAKSLEIGDRVLVPFGRGMLEGAVISLNDHPPTGMRASTFKEIRSRLTGTTNAGASSTLFELSRKIAERYVAPWGQCLRLVFPPVPAREARPPRYVVTDQGRAALKSEGCPDHLRPLLHRIARRSRGVLSATLLRSRDRAIRRAVKELEGNSWIAVTTSRTEGADGPFRKRTATLDQLDQEGLARLAGELPEQDPLWARRVTEGLQAGGAKTIMLHAPWEQRVSCLVAAANQVHATNKSILVVAGEAARAEWLSRLLLTMTKLPILLLRASSRSDQWKQIQERPPVIVVGTRSAVFAPLRSIGLIWVDGEDDPAMKEPQEPRYHARDVACMRAEVEGALVVLASAHPSLEAKAAAGTDVLIAQSHASHRPNIALVDLRDEGGSPLFSRRLLAEMQQALDNKAGVFLFLNRKGYASALVCPDCGWIPRCPSCAVALTYYQHGDGGLACRYCGMKVPLLDCCSTCRASRLDPLGAGTERVEIEARRRFPDAKIARFDGDTLCRASTSRRLWEGARSREWDIVVGTQVMFQRDPLPLMGLVGIIQAESGLHLPDFRAAERTYGLLVDAVSVALPAIQGGLVVLQTRLPDHHAVQAVLSGNPDRFYEVELAGRHLLGYPPAHHLASLMVSGKEQATAQTSAEQWRNYLEQPVDGQEPLTVLGPVPAAGGRLKGLSRFLLLVKGPERAVLCRRIHESLERLEQGNWRGLVKFLVDMDPVEMG